MKILLGTNQLNSIGGTEMYTLTILEELLKRDCVVDIFTLHEGKISNFIKQNYKCKINENQNNYDLSILNHYPVVEKISNQNISKAIIQTCHGSHLLEQPYLFGVDHHISISKELQDRLLEKKILSKLILNGINCEKFSPSKKIRKKLKSVLSLSQSEEFNFLLSEVCKKNNIDFISHNKFTNPIINIQKIINQVDLVVSLGRGAYEAMSCGRSVLIADKRPYQDSYMDGLINENNIDKYLINNCSGRSSKIIPTFKNIEEQFKKYNFEHGDFNRDFALKNLNIKKQIDLYFELINNNYETDLKKNKHSIKILNEPFVSIIIPVYNKIELTKKCIESIINLTVYNNYEIILIDNASTDGTKKYLKKISLKYNNIKIIYNKENLGFAKANNQGAKKAKGKYLLCLNNDIEVKKRWLQPLVKILNNDSNVACVGSKLLFPNGCIQHAGVAIMEKDNQILPVHLFHGLKNDIPEANKVQSYQALTAACLLIRKSVFMKVCGFDEKYWNGYEDVDLCFKVRELNFKIVYEPKSVLIHHESQSGHERFTKVNENILLLQKKWKNKILFDGRFINENNYKLDHENSIEPYFHDDEKTLISIILLTYNAIEYTKKCINSILMNTFFNFELIVVDNNSNDGTSDYLRQLSNENSNIKIKLNKTNVGFSRGNNQGVSLSSGEFIAILNNDTLVPKGWLTKFYNSLKLDKNIGAVGPLSNSISGRQQIVVPYKTDHEYFDFSLKRINKKNNTLTPRRRLAGFCIFLKKETYIDIGGFTEKYKIGNYEDDDFSLKIRKKGLSLMVDESIVVHHYGSVSFDINKINYHETMNENYKIFKKNWPNVDYEELIEVKNNLIDWEKNNISISYEHYKSSRYKESLKYIDKIEKLNPISKEALFLKALNNIALENFNAAEIPLNKILKIDSNNTAALLQKGIICISKNNFEESINYFNQIIDLDPLSIDPYLFRSEAYLSQGIINKSIDSMIETANIFPKSVENLERLCTVFNQQNNIKEAKDVAKLIIEIDKENIIANKILT